MPSTSSIASVQVVESASVTPRTATSLCEPLAPAAEPRAESSTRRRCSQPLAALQLPATSFSISANPFASRRPSPAMVTAEAPGFSDISGTRLPPHPLAGGGSLARSAVERITAPASRKSVVWEPTSRVSVVRNCPGGTSTTVVSCVPLAASSAFWIAAVESCAPVGSAPRSRMLTARPAGGGTGASIRTSSFCSGPASVSTSIIR